ncbi:MAG: hypothetical protein C4531_06300 [Desulfurivibrio sp.]|nr:MAG: hypothetical protein C4531_06300 [Desulfurivibrio sp.]
MQKNNLLFRAKISEAQFAEILRLFALDLNGCQIAELLGINRNTANRYVMAIRKKIAQHCRRGCCCDREQEGISVNLVSGVRGRNPSMQHVLIWLFEEEGHVYAEIVPLRFTGLMQGIMRGKVRADGVLEALGLTSCRAIANMDNKRIFHLQEKGDGGRAKRALITPVDRFWVVFKQRMIRLRGIKRSSLPYHLKECEFRFNNAHQDILGLLHGIITYDH